MRISINLASQPYVDLRADYRRWLTATVVLAVLTLALGLSAALGIRQRRGLDNDIRALSEERNHLNADLGSARQLLQRPESVAVRERALFLNDIILRKSFSWTSAFEELETLMPAHAQVVSIQPELGPDRQLYIHLMVSGERDGAIELVRRLETSSQFSNPVLRSEATNDPKTQPAAGGVTFDITAIYTGGKKTGANS